MNKLVLFLFMLFCATNKANAQYEHHGTHDGVKIHQEKRFFQKISTGVTWGTFMEKEFYAEEVKKIHPDWHVSVNAGFDSPYGNHGLTYNLGHNSLGLLNRFFLDSKHKWSLMVLYEDVLNSIHNSKRFSFGVERAFEVKTQIPSLEVEIIPFIELGTIILEEENFFSFGVLIKTHHVPFHRIKH